MDWNWTKKTKNAIKTKKLTKDENWTKGVSPQNTRKETNWQIYFVYDIG